MTHRDSIALESARIVSHRAYPADQYVMRLFAPQCAQRAAPGSFVHLQCAPDLLMRRPFSIMRASAGEGWIELLYKVVGEGTQRLSERRAEQTLSLLGPIGRGFERHSRYPRALLIGGGVGIPPMIFLAEDIVRAGAGSTALAILGSEVPFPFNPRPSQLLTDSMPAQATATMPLLEDWGVPCRLASLQGYAGCFDGYVTDLARAWLSTLESEALTEVEIFACGPHAMLAAVADLAEEFQRPCQVSLEEYMACAVGGCAGCTVRVRTAQGEAMKRVCVDGPVFPASAVFGAAPAA